MREGLNGYFRKQVLSVSVEEFLEGFHRWCVHYLSRQFIPKWDSPNAESVLATVGTTSLLVELIGVAAWPRLDGWRSTARGIPEDHRWSGTWIFNPHGFAGVKGRKAKALAELLHMRRTEAISELVSAPFPIPLRRRIGWDDFLT